MKGKDNKNTHGCKLSPNPKKLISTKLGTNVTVHRLVGGSPENIFVIDPIVVSPKASSNVQ
ncbi:MAG: hypothetical protein AAFU57_08070 [Bacteroidota bacterium]